MALMTVRIYDVLKNLSYNKGFLPWDSLINETFDLFFDFEFPWYNYRRVGLTEFKKLYLHRNLMKEIGQESLELHKHTLYTRLSENMQSYKQMFDSIESIGLLINSTNLEYNEVLDTVRDGMYNEDRMSTGSGKTDTNTQSIHSDNPQITFGTNDYASTMDRGQIITEQESKISDARNTSTKDTGKETRVWTKKGYENKDINKLVTDIRTGVYNVNLSILRDCDRLFLGVW